jgi:magnesium chelatase family protein
MRQPVGSSGSSAAVAGRVAEARRRAAVRFAELPWRTNAEMPGFEFRRRCPLAAEVARPIENLVAAGRLTQRGADRVNRLAWTIADLGGRDRPTVGDVGEAIYLRSRGVNGRNPVGDQVA